MNTGSQIDLELDTYFRRESGDAVLFCRASWERNDTTWQFLRRHFFPSRGAPGRAWRLLSINSLELGAYGCDGEIAASTPEAVERCAVNIFVTYLEATARGEITAGAQGLPFRYSMLDVATGIEHSVGGRVHIPGGHK